MLNGIHISSCDAERFIPMFQSFKTGVVNAISSFKNRISSKNYSTFITIFYDLKTYIQTVAVVQGLMIGLSYGKWVNNIR